MGLGEVWSLFPEAASSLQGKDAIASLEDRTVAIDAAIWIVEATCQVSATLNLRDHGITFFYIECQGGMRQHFDTKSAVLKVFDSCLILGLG